MANHTGVRTVTVIGALAMLVAMATIALLRPAVFTSLGDPGQVHAVVEGSLLRPRLP